MFIYPGNKCIFNINDVLGSAVVDDFTIGSIGTFDSVVVSDFIIQEEMKRKSKALWMGIFCMMQGEGELEMNRMYVHKS